MPSYYNLVLREGLFSVDLAAGWPMGVEVDGHLDMVWLEGEVTGSGVLSCWQLDCEMRPRKGSVTSH